MSGDTTKIWRYYSNLGYFCNVVLNESLYFCRIDRFDDPLEGTVPDGVWKEMFSELPSNESQKATAAQKRAREIVWRKRTYANCWHINETENYAFWKIYGEQEGAVAIMSSRSKLREELTDEVKLERVKYIDFSRTDEEIRDIFNKTWNTLRYKHQPYEYEKELRAIIHLDIDDTDEPSGEVSPGRREIRPQINPGKLINKVMVAPWSEDGFERTVREYVERSEVDCAVDRSGIPLSDKH